MKRTWISIVSIVTIAIFILSFNPYKKDFFEISKQIEIFIDLYKELNTNYVDDLIPSQVMGKAIKGVLTELDPYTVYRNEQQIIDARINHSGQYAGIGAKVHFSQKYITLLECYENAPAQKAGMEAGDRIKFINGTKVSEINSDLQHNLLSGEAGSEINIIYDRNNKEYETTITRERMERNAVPYYKLLDDNIGYIVLEAFNQNAAIQTKNALIDLKQQGAEKIVLDLRNNPGGLLNESIKIVNLFVNKGLQITYTESVIKKYNTQYITQDEPVDTEIPLAVLINEQSASASEIVSGSLQDLDRAVIIGNRSFGKGLVQREMPLSYSTQLKITISRYFTPSGRSIQKLDYETDLVDKRNIQEKNQIFYTKNNRKVYGGGGILPDKIVQENIDQDFIKQLVNNLYLFDFTSEYLKKNKLNSIENFSLKNSDWNDFKQYLNSKEPLSKTYSSWKQLLEVAKEEGIEENIKALEEKFNLTVEKEMNNKLDSHRKIIESQISDIIIRRTFYQTKAYDYALNHHDAILIAKEVLNNKKEYDKILNN